MIFWLRGTQCLELQTASDTIGNIGYAISELWHYIEVRLLLPNFTGKQRLTSILFKVKTLYATY